MQADTAAVAAYFAKIGLSQDLADVYRNLLEHGPQNMLQLSRNTAIERTRLYRLIDKLQEVALVEIETHYKRTVIKAAPLTNLQILFTAKEAELRQLQDELQQLDAALQQPARRSPLTHIQFYHGQEGLKQMFWNQAKAQSETYAILYENMQSRTGSNFFIRWVEKCNQRGLRFKGIIGDYFITTQQSWYKTHANERLVHWESRYVPESLYPITHSTITYDNVIAYYSWKKGEIFGIEIYNAEIAQAQQQLFRLLWDKAVPVDDLKGLPPDSPPAA